MTRLSIMLLFAIGMASAKELDPRQMMAGGERAYQEKQYGPAQHAFAAAATNAASQKLDPAVARYDEAAANYRLGNMDLAAERLAEALRTGDLQLQQKAWYNRGNTLLGRMTAQQQQGKLDEAKKSAEEAATHFEQAIMLDPSDADAKVNYELSLRLQEELEKQKQQQEQQQNQQKQDQQKQDQNKQDKQNDKKNDQQKQESGQDQKQQQQNQPQPSQQPKPDQSQQQEQKQKQQGEKKNDEMTPDEAAMLLNAMRQEEQANRDKLRLNIGQPEPVEKDW